MSVEHPPSPAWSEESVGHGAGHVRNFSRPFLGHAYGPQRPDEILPRTMTSSPEESLTYLATPRLWDNEHGHSVQEQDIADSAGYSTPRTNTPHPLVYKGDMARVSRRLGMDVPASASASAEPSPRNVTGHQLAYKGDMARASRRLGIDVATAEQQATAADQPIPRRPMAFQRMKSFQKWFEDGKFLHEPPKTASEGSSDLSAGPPDGGFVAWAHAVSGFIVCMNTQGLNMSFGVFQSYYEKVMLRRSSPAKIAWIGSFQLFACFFICLFTGPLISKGYFRICFNGGSALLFVCLLLTSFCKSWWELFLVQGVLCGIAMGFVFTSAIMIATTYFSTRLGIATGIAAAGSSFGGILFPLITKNALFSVGFGWSIRIVALVNLVTMIPVNVIVRQRPGWKSTPPGSISWYMFKDLPYLLMMAGMFFAFWGAYFGFYFIGTFGQDILKLSTDTSLNLLVVMNSANVVGRFVPNLISDKCIGPINTLIPTTILSSVLIYLWTGVTTETSLFLVACFYGFMAAGIQSLYTPTIFSFAGTDRLTAGVRVGVVYAVIGIGCLTGAPLGGQLLVANDGDYFYAQIFSGTALLLGGLLFLGSRLAKRGWKAVRL